MNRNSFRSEGRGMNRVIIHVDMDAFYASVEQRDDPALRGKPVIVGADPKTGRGRGVVSAASYEARQFGVHSAQPISKAYRLCPQGIFLPVRGRRYAEVSRRIMDIFRAYTPLVETISLDEAFLDMTGTEKLLGPAKEVGRRIKGQIREQESLTASVGIGPNKLVAKIASDLEKPDGFVVVRSEDVQAFLAPLPVGKLWGIGKKTEERLADLGIRTVGELAVLSQETLERMFGRMGLVLWERAHGIDGSPVVPLHEAKSISNERTFEEDVGDPSVLQNTLLRLSEKVGYRLRKAGLVGRTVVLKVRLSDFTTFVRHATFSGPTFLGETIYAEALSLFENVNLRRQAVRLLGVGMTQLSSATAMQTDLFGEGDEKRKRVSQAVDRLKQKYGEGVIGRGTLGG